MTERPAGHRELLRELDALSRGYGSRPGDAPPAAVDAAVLARARASAGRRRVPAWWVPATLAATVVIAFSLMLRVQEDAATAPAVMEAASPGADEAAPAATAAAPASAEVAEASPQVAAQVPPAAPPPLPARSFQAAPAEDAAATEGAAARATEAAPQPGAAAPRTPASAKAAGLPDPEAWLEKIEALEARGRTEEATAERERLEAAYPGWLGQRSGSRD